MARLGVHRTGCMHYKDWCTVQIYTVVAATYKTRTVLVKGPLRAKAMYKSTAVLKNKVFFFVQFRYNFYLS